MFDTYQTNSAGPKCVEVADKIVQLFGWRHTYNVEKLQRNVVGRATTRISITRTASGTPSNGSLKSGTEAWLSVHNLKSQGGGILDPDDRLCDVVDDREQILASFEDGEGLHHGGGDGASGSSVGTGSPDIFQDGEHKYGPSYPRTDIEVTGEQIASGGSGSLQVRRGSEPALNQLPVGPPPPTDNTKRWSAAPLIIEPPSLGYVSNSSYDDSKEPEDGGHFKRVGRDGTNRLSMQFFEDGAGYRWAEAADRAAYKAHTSTSLPRQNKRKEPLGQANNTSPIPTVQGPELIIIENEPGPLGIHVVPDYDLLGKDRGLLVQGIEPGGRIDRDGRLEVYDRIIEINGQNLLNMPFQRVQEMFKVSLSSELRLKVIKNSNSSRLQPSSLSRFPEENKENISMVEGEPKSIINTKVATVSPTKKIPSVSKNVKSLLSANTRKIGKKIEIELVKGIYGLGFSITTRDNPAGGNCPIYIKGILPKGAAIEDGRLKMGDRLLEVNGIEMTGKSQSEAVTILRNTPPGSKVTIIVSRQGEVENGTIEESDELSPLIMEEKSNADIPPAIPPLPQCHLQNRLSEKGSVAKIVSQFQDSYSRSPSDSLDDSLVFPWKHREIMTLNIPVHDSEKAGLGISVKGKTSGSQDLGIFIKCVINGGAASRDKRLRTNDQLLNVNGISLLHQSNSDAMETLRKAMLHTEGPVPDNITLTIARRGDNVESRSNSSSGQNLSSGAGSLSNDSDSLPNDNSGASGSSTNTVIYNPYLSRDELQTSNINPMHTWNPVIDRLTGNNPQLRNESYYKATHDTWSSSMLGNTSIGGNTTTVNISGDEPVLIEDEYGSRVLNHQYSRFNIHMKNKTVLPNGIIPENRKDHEPDGKANLPGNLSDNKSVETSSQSTLPGTDVTYASQLSLENPQGFARDAFGRQSMSEKRHATLDAKSTDTYQRTKKMREKRTKDRETNLVRVGSVESVISVNRSSEHPECADKLGELGPSLGMKKSSSLESLQTMVQEIQMQEEGDPAYMFRGPTGALKVIRGRGCEKSFRAAVDNHISENDNQRDMAAKKHWLLDGPTDEREVDGFTNVRGGSRQSSLNASLDGKHKAGKKKAGIFRGIGSMFRFGKHRKMEFPSLESQYRHNSDFDSAPNHNEELRQSQSKHTENVSPLRNQNDKGQEQTHPQKMFTNQNSNNVHHHQQAATTHHNVSPQKEPLYQRHGYVHKHAEHVQVIPENVVPPPVKYRNGSGSDRSRRMSRKPPDQRFGARHTYYQSDDRGDMYEQRAQPLRVEANGEYGRPGSRSGITESVPFTHYVNYNELQNHLSRKQHQYHSQRQTRTDNHLRPVSNFYEYETIQSVLNTRNRHNIPNHHINSNKNQIHSNAAHFQDVNANSLSRQPPGIANVPLRNNRGPYITQVTIEQQKNGTKV